MKNLTIGPLPNKELEEFCEAMSVLPWYRDMTMYSNYLEEESKGLRQFLVAKYKNSYAGHVSLLWESGYEGFKLQNIPEISDLLVLPSYQRQGIATSLMETCEEIALNMNKQKVGLGVGLYRDYGPAIALYTRRGYQLDCCGATSHLQPIIPGKQVMVDDDLLIWLIKDCISSNK